MPEHIVKRKPCHGLKGSATIEACVVVPISMIILVSIIFLAYFVHDQAVMTAVSDYALMDNAGRRNAGNAQQMISSVLNRKLYGASGISAGAGGSGGKLHAGADASFLLPDSMVRTIMGENTRNLHARISISFLESRKKLLLYKSICDGLPEFLKKGSGQT